MIDTNKRILFICKKRIDSYGISFGLLNSASFIANALKEKGFDTKVVCVFDGNCIEREVFSYKPAYVIIHALWVIPSKIKTLIEKYKETKWIIRIHSQLPFIANEGIAFDWINKLNDLSSCYENILISGNNKVFSEDLNKLNVKNVYLPNIYHPSDELPDVKYIKRDDGYIDIGCFGALRPMKNHLIQAVAAIDFANKNKKKLKFHINGDRIEQHGDQPLKNIRAVFENSYHELIEHEWMTHLEFISLIKTMDIGMQVSFSESFNIVAADFVNNKIPIVVSDEINWLPYFTKAKTTSTHSITRKLNFNYHLNNIMFDLIAFLNKIKLKKYNSEAIKTWLEFLK
jgi:hypothetical protein